MSVKKIIVILISLITASLLIGCGGTETIIGIKMIEPEPTSEYELTYEDKNTKFTFRPYVSSYSSGYWGLKLEEGLKGIIFEITNKTNDVIKVKWNEASLVKPDGTASRIIHSGVSYVDRDKELTATTIPAKAKLQDHITPSENISFSSNKYWGGWKTYPIIEYKDINKQELGLLLPIQIKEKTHNYHFKFLVYTME